MYICRNLDIYAQYNLVESYVYIYNYVYCKAMSKVTNYSPIVIIHDMFYMTHWLHYIDVSQ